MAAAALVTLVLTGLLIAALAFYLLWVSVILRRVNGALAQIGVHVQTVADRTEPLEPALTEVNAALRPVADRLEELAAAAGNPRTVA